MARMIALLSLVVVAFAAENLEFIVMGDWGGQPNKPYTTPDEVATAKGMGIIAEQFNVSFVWALGDNFYYTGVKNEFDPRFKETFEDVYTAPSLQCPWYMLAGNHDHNGNVTGQIAYSTHSKRWRFPSEYYTETFPVPGSSKTVELVSIDTVELAGLVQDWQTTQPPGPANSIDADKQWEWIESTLAASRADYLLVAGHYPVYSIAEHGPTDILVQRLKPMLIKYGAQAYFCGHDHTLEYIEDEAIGYVVTGAAHYCDRSTAHTHSVPKNSLKSHECHDGGFTRVSVNDQEMVVYYYDGDANLKYTTHAFMPRHRHEIVAAS